MHDSSLRKIEAFASGYLSSCQNRALRILDLGSRNVDGMRTYRPFFERATWDYLGVDIEAGTNVDIVINDPYHWTEIESNSADVLVSGQTLEHIEYPWLTMQEIARVLRPGGVVCLVVPSAGPEHRYPVDCWRFYTDGLHALANYAGLRIVEAFTDWGLGQWQDSFAVLQKAHSEDDGDCALPRLEDLGVAKKLYLDPASRGNDSSASFYAHAELMESREGRHTAAVMLLREGVQKYPDNAYLHQRLVGCLVALGSPGAAIEHLLRLLALAPAAAPTLRVAEMLLKRLSSGDKVLLCAAMDKLPVSMLARAAEASFSESAHEVGALLWESLARLRPEQFECRINHAVALLGTSTRAQGLRRLEELRAVQLRDGIVNRTTVLQQLVSRLGARNYVEIGVERGSNLLQIEAPLRIAVDPDFAVPGGTAGIAGTLWFAKPSDTFFAEDATTILPDGADLVFIDGLHTYAQALRDVQHALRHLNENGVIVLHDCLPKSAAEALPDQDEAKRHPEFRNAWTGDVYRAVIHLRATRKDLEVFVLDTDHGVGIVRRGNCKQPVEIDPRCIAELQFEEFFARRHYWLDLKAPEFFEQWLCRIGTTEAIKA